jgi:hypothetical protein
MAGAKMAQDDVAPRIFSSSSSSSDDGEDASFNWGGSEAPSGRDDEDKEEEYVMTADRMEAMMLREYYIKMLNQNQQKLDMTVLRSKATVLSLSTPSLRHAATHTCTQASRTRLSHAHPDTHTRHRHTRSTFAKPCHAAEGRVPSPPPPLPYVCVWVCVCVCVCVCVPCGPHGAGGA